MNFDDAAIVTVKGHDYRIKFWFMMKKKAVDRMKDADLTENKSVYNGSSVVICLRPFVHLIRFFHMHSNKFVVLYFPKQRLLLLACKRDDLRKPRRTSCKIYKHVVQR